MINSLTDLRRFLQRRAGLQPTAYQRFVFSDIALDNLLQRLAPHMSHAFMYHDQKPVVSQWPHGAIFQTIHATAAKGPEVFQLQDKQSALDFLMSRLLTEIVQTVANNASLNNAVKHGSDPKAIHTRRTPYKLNEATLNEGQRLQQNLAQLVRKNV